MSSHLPYGIAARDIPQKDLPIAAARHELRVVFRNTSVAHFVSVSRIRLDEYSTVGVPQTRRSILDRVTSPLLAPYASHFAARDAMGALAVETDGKDRSFVSRQGAHKGAWHLFLGLFFERLRGKIRTEIH